MWRRLNRGAFFPRFTKDKLPFHFVALPWIVYHDGGGKCCYRWLGMMHAMTFQNISDSSPFQNRCNLWERKPLMSRTYTFIYDTSWKCGLIRGMQMYFLCVVAEEVMAQRGWYFSLCFSFARPPCWEASSVAVPLCFLSKPPRSLSLNLQRVIKFPNCF